MRKTPIIKQSPDRIRICRKGSFLCLTQGKVAVMGVLGPGNLFYFMDLLQSWRNLEELKVFSTASSCQEKLRKRKRGKKRTVQTDGFNESTAPLPAAVCPSQCAQALSIQSPNIFQNRAGLHSVAQRARGSAWACVRSPHVPIKLLDSTK